MENKSLTVASKQVTKQDLDEWLFGSGTKLTEQQKSLFYQVALTNNLNPIRREVYAIPYGTNFNIIVSYEIYLKRAERTGNLEWWEAGVKRENNEYIGFCTIKRRDRAKETTIEAWFNEYNQNNNMWKTKPRTMIRKFAIAQAFRMVFPDELGGLPYTADEMGTNDQIIDVQPQKEMTKVEKTIAALNDVGKLGNAEKFVGKPSSQWTDADIDKIEAAKKKKETKEEKTESPESPTSPVSEETKGKVSPMFSITDEQIDQIKALCKTKNVLVAAALPDGVAEIIRLTMEEADAVIQRLAEL